MKWDVRGFGDEYVQYSTVLAEHICLNCLLAKEINSTSPLPIRKSNSATNIIFTMRLPVVLEPVCKSAGLCVGGVKLRRYSSKAVMSHDIWKGLLYVWRKPTDTYNSHRLFPTVKPGSFFVPFSFPFFSFFWVLTALLQILIRYWLICEVLRFIYRSNVEFSNLISLKVNGLNRKPQQCKIDFIQYTKHINQKYINKKNQPRGADFTEKYANNKF